MILGQRTNALIYLRTSVLLRFCVTLSLSIQLAMKAFRHGLSTTVANGNDYRCRLEQCVSLLESNGWFGDDRWYLTLANNFSQGKWLSPDEMWILRLWPPGMGGLYTAIHFASLDRLGVYAIVAMLSVALWSYLFWLLVSKSTRVGSLVITVVVLQFLISTRAINEWMFGPSISYSETITVALSSIFIISSCTSGTRPYLRGVLLGSVLAITTYMRAMFDLFGILLVLFFLLVMIVLTARKQTRVHLQRPIIKQVAMTCLVFMIATLPWRIYSHESLTGSWGFNGHGSTAWINGWIPSDIYRLNGNGYFVDLGINGFCQVYDQRCNQIRRLEVTSSSPYSEHGYYTASEFRSFAINSVISDPIPWFMQRLKYLRQAVQDAVSQTFLGRQALYFVIGIAFLLCGSLLLSQVRRLNDYGSVILVVFNVLLFIASIGPLFFASFEPRYTYPIVVAALVSFLMVNIWIWDKPSEVAETAWEIS